jgi:hypothetical protein
MMDVFRLCEWLMLSNDFKESRGGMNITINFSSRPHGAKKKMQAIGFHLLRAAGTLKFLKVKNQPVKIFFNIKIPDQGGTLHQV